MLMEGLVKYVIFKYRTINKNQVSTSLTWSHLFLIGYVP